MPIEFNEKRMCPRCENEIKSGGYLLLPGTDEIKHYCFQCCLELIAEYNESKNIRNPKVKYLKIEPKDLGQ